MTVAQEYPPDVLARRYATPQMINLWSPRAQVRAERQLWVAAMKAQRTLGVNIPEAAIDAYEAAIDDIDLAWIAEREKVTRHDVKAKIEAFNLVAGGHEYIHRGFTSRDLTDCVEQMTIRATLELVSFRALATLHHFQRRMHDYRDLAMCARTHNVAAQVTTLGHRFGMWAEELLTAFGMLDSFMKQYPFRGIKGPVGTQQDMIDLLGSPKAALEFERRIAEHLGFSRICDGVGQVYPRSLDFAVTSLFVQLASACGNFAKTFRLMAGQELAHEGFKKGQTGSSAMPHKVNSRTCERINGFVTILNGFHAMTGSLIGDQWNEGDVSCSVVRRVALPGSAYAIDGLLEATMTVLNELQVFPGMIERELENYGPYVNSTRILLALVEAGLGREQAHELVKRHATAAINERRVSAQAPGFISRMIGDSACSLEESQLRELCHVVDGGAADAQISEIDSRTSSLGSRYPDAYKYEPGVIL